MGAGPNIVPTTAESKMTAITLSLAASGAHFVLGFGSHTVRVPVPEGAAEIITTGRKTLVALRDRLHETSALEPSARIVFIEETMAQIETVLAAVRVAEKALVGLTLMHGVLKANASEPAALINSRAVPTQALVDAFLKNGGKVEDQAERDERKFEERFGVSTDDLLALMGEEAPPEIA